MITSLTLYPGLCCLLLCHICWLLLLSEQKAGGCVTGALHWCSTPLSALDWGDSELSLTHPADPAGHTRHTNTQHTVTSTVTWWGFGNPCQASIDQKTKENTAILKMFNKIKRVLCWQKSFDQSLSAGRWRWSGVPGGQCSLQCPCCATLANISRKVRTWTHMDTHGHTQGTSGCSNESPCHPVPCCIRVIYFWVWETLLPVAGPGRSRQLGVSVCTNIRMGAASHYEMYIETETSLYWTQVAWFKHFKTLLNRKYIRSLCICLHVYNRRYLHES